MGEKHWDTRKRERNGKSVAVRWKGRGIGRRRREKNRGNHQEVGNVAAPGDTDRSSVSMGL